MPVKELSSHLKEHWSNIRTKLDERGRRFVRYADDGNIYVRSERAAEQVLTSTQEFIEMRMRLKANEEKSAVDLATIGRFLGFSFY